MRFCAAACWDRTLARTVKAAQISDLASVLAAIGGGVVISLYDDDRLFGLYAIGLFAGFFLYLLAFLALNGKKKTGTILGNADTVQIGRAHV